MSSSRVHEKFQTVSYIQPRVLISIQDMSRNYVQICVLTQYILLGKYDNKLISTHIIDGTIYDTVFQTTNGFALILRVYLPLDPSRAPTMTLHGVRASHNWLDIRMKVIGYTPISTDQRWKSSNLKLGDAVYAVIHHFQLTPRELFVSIILFLQQICIFIFYLN